MPKQAVISTAFAAPAFYGKIPAHGDFISRGLARGYVSEIDSWLTEWLETAKTEWGESFEENYRASQPWLFSGKSLTGVLIPSFDRVERLFPLLAVIGAGAKLQQLYDAVISAIAERLTGDQLIEGLAGLDCLGDVSEPTGWFLPDPNEVSMPHPFSGTNTEWAKEAMK